MAGFNFGPFFGGGVNNSSGNIFDTFNFSDYSSIKNGSYRKLVQSYYAKDKVDNKVKTDKVDKNDKTGRTDNKKNTTKFDIGDTTGLSKMKKETDALASSVDALDNNDLWKTKDGKYDMDKIADAVKSFVSEYNNTLDQSMKVNNTEVSKNMSNMQSMTNVMSKTLSKIGVTVGADRKLSVNEDTLKEANIKDIKELFDGSHSYASQIQKYANDASKAAVNGSSVYSSNGTLSSSLQGMFNNWI